MRINDAQVAIGELGSVLKGEDPTRLGQLAAQVRRRIGGGSPGYLFRFRRLFLRFRRLLAFVRWWLPAAIPAALLGQLRVATLARIRGRALQGQYHANHHANKE